MVPESFTWACRFIRLSIRSPTIDTATVTAASSASATNAAPRTPSSQPPAPATSTPATIAPYAPAQVLPGLICGASLRLPNVRPLKYAPISDAHTITSASKVHQWPCGARAWMLTRATQAGKITNAPASSFSARFSRVGAAANAKWRSHRQASSHQATPAASSSGVSTVAWARHSKANTTAATTSSTTRHERLFRPLSSAHSHHAARNASATMVAKMPVGGSRMIRIASGASTRAVRMR